MSPLYQTEVHIFLKSCERRKRRKERKRAKRKRSWGKEEGRRWGQRSGRRTGKSFPMKNCCPRYLRLPSLYTYEDSLECSLSLEVCDVQKHKRLFSMVIPRDLD